uniref:Uncharacterized protein n=1 Tax=Haloferax volcanii (strain ATCC 29605 / DSM 3757 / JCM 8879 / NBRC 14742 / NCIMB 2012 / VKM B-1768 / DS2) TaxID=309800 RepID=D4H0D5_HALVD
MSAAGSFCKSSSTEFSITVAPVTVVVVARHVVAIGRCSRAQSSGRVSLTFRSPLALSWSSLLSPPRSCVVFDVVASAVAAVSPLIATSQSRRRARCHGDADRVTAGGFVTFPPVSLSSLYRVSSLFCDVTGVASRRRSLSGRSRTLGLPAPPVAAWRGLVRIGHCFLAPLVP